MNVICTTKHASVTPLYEQDELSLVTGGTLRPGGIGLTSEILTSYQPVPGSTALDVGCGPGRTVALMAENFGLQVTGLDPSASMLARAADFAPSSSFVRGEATAIPCESGTFATVIAECVLCLTGDIVKSVQEMHRVLQPGGTLILTDIYRKQAQVKPGFSPQFLNLQSCISYALPLEDIENALYTVGFTQDFFQDRSDLLKQLAGQIIFSYGSLEKFWQLFMGKEAARQTSCALAGTPLGYYVLIAKKGAHYG